MMVHIPRGEFRKKNCRHPPYAVSVKVKNKITSMPEVGKCRLCDSEVVLVWKSPSDVI